VEIERRRVHLLAGSPQRPDDGEEDPHVVTDHEDALGTLPTHRQSPGYSDA
jgi:hypothetical protein